MNVFDGFSFGELIERCVKGKWWDMFYVEDEVSNGCYWSVEESEWEEEFEVSDVFVV